MIVAVTIVIYNSLVRLRETGDAAWADIDVQLKRRYDLIPNIVETLESVVAARSGAIRDATRLRIPSVVGRGIRHRPQR